MSEKEQQQQQHHHLHKEFARYTGEDKLQQT